jgi:hypothetical protein
MVHERKFNTCTGRISMRTMLYIKNSQICLLNIKNAPNTP